MENTKNCSFCGADVCRTPGTYIHSHDLMVCPRCSKMVDAISNSRLRNAGIIPDEIILINENTTLTDLANSIAHCLQTAQKYNVTAEITDIYGDSCSQMEVGVEVRFSRRAK